MNAYLDKTSSQLIERTNRIGVGFLLADLDLGMTFLQMAHTTNSASAQTRLFNQASEVYRTVVRLLPRVVPAPHEQLEIQQKLADLRLSLKRSGRNCEE